jgi:hypothetical protein
MDARFSLVNLVGRIAVFVVPCQSRCHPSSQSKRVLRKPAKQGGHRGECPAIRACKTLEIEECGFLPKAATPLFQRFPTGLRFSRMGLLLARYGTNHCPKIPHSPKS